MNAVDGKEAKAGKKAGNYGVCKGMLGLKFPTLKKKKFPINRKEMPKGLFSNSESQFNIALGKVRV